MDETSRTDPGDAHAAELDHVTSAKAAQAVQVWQLFKYADALDCLLMAVGTCGAMAHGMVLPINMHFFGRIVNSLGQNQHAPGVAAAAVAKFALVMFIVALNSAWVTWLEVACWMHTGERQSAKIRTKYLESLLHQEVAFFDSGVGSGEVVSRIAEDTLLVHEAIGEKVGSLIHNLTTFAGGLAVALVNSPPLALLTLAVVPLLSVSGAFFNGKYMALAAQTQQKCTQASNVVEQTISQVRTVYSFVGETRAVAAFSKALEAATKPRLMSGLVKGLGIGFSLFFLNSSWALQLWYGSKLVAKHGTDGGKILTTVFCVVFGGMALGQATLTLQIVSRGRVAAYNIFQVIDRKSAIDSRAATGQILSSLQGRIELDNVCFAYPSRPEATIFNGLSLTIPEARSTALVGGSGSGKSTVISLIQRLYDVSSGEIRIDGADIRSLQLSWMRSTMGLVAQEPALFATTIRANICLGAAGDDVEVSQEQVEEAAKAANAHSFISDLPAGYDTLVGERGVQLSGGQKQRIAIARAIVRSPKILLLDEATSALDAASERLVQEAVDKLMVGRTTLVVAHRLSTIKHCDHIAVFHHGRIVEMGSHEELVGNPDGVYSSLVQVQEIGTQSGTGTGNAYGDADDEVENVPIPATPRFPSPFEANSKVKPGAPDAASPSLYKLLPEGPGAGIDAPPRESGVLSSALRRNWYIFLKIVGAGQRQSSTMVPESAFTVRDFHKMVGAEWISVGLGSICAVVSGSLNPLFAFFLIDVVTLYYDTGRRPGYVREHVDRWCLLYAALALVAVFSNSAQHYLFARTGDRVSKKMRERAFEAVMKNEVGWFDREENGSSAITARLASDAALVDGAVSDSTSLLVQYVASALIAMTMGFVIKWQMALITILTFPFSMAGGSMKQGFMSKGFSGDLAEMHDKAMSLAGEAVSNIRTVASLGGQGKVVHLFKQQLSSPAREILVRSQIGGLVFGISQAALHSGNAMGLWYVSVLVARGEATYSEALKVFQVLAWTGYVLAEALSLFPDIKRGILGGQTLGSVTRRATQIDPDHGLLFVPTTGSILLDKVSFSYPSRPDVPVLRDLSLRVETGTTAALVGASGSGKSSIFSLLLRFYDPAGGAILLDGVHITTVNLRSLRQSMSLVQQEPALFGSLSIGDNIRYGNEHASEAEVVKAATLAHAHTFISALPDGYRTQVGERGVHLSGGQKQRIAIARAVLKDAPILLLDEATSALDAASESAVLEALEQQRPRKTMLVIAHRLSTVQNAHVIFAMHNGRVVESGTHGDLLANAQGLYSHLVGINSKIGGAQPLDEPAG